MTNAFEWIRLSQTDIDSGVTAVFSVDGDGTWEDVVDQTSGSLTRDELHTLERLFKDFQKSHYATGPVVGEDLGENFYSLDSAAKTRHGTSQFYNVIYDDGAGPTLAYGPSETVLDPLDTFVQHLATLYGDGVIV